MPMEQVPANLISRRVNLGLSITLASRAMKVDRRTLERAERGESVSPSSAKKIAGFYGLQVTDVWSVEEWAA
jgi:transcriptional regulator with XRE-family HTH domain